MTNPVEAPPELPRFSRAERVVHRTFTVLMIICVITAFILYNGAIGIRVGHRRLIELIHVYSGLALPVPVLIGLASRSFRRDLRRLNRFSPSDWQWLRGRRRRRGEIRVGKFNPGQKLNASLVAGATLVLTGTGLLMFFPGLARLTWRTGSTFVHDWFSLGLGLLILGHITFALKDPEARRGMRTGRVSATWVRSEHPAWADEINAAEHPTPD
ncbi:MAG: formate dehydrogenase [Pseudonocardiales bacterium]|nr:MAG: formate dehydrogenase [Pseudonocardiales bacterium]